MEFNTDRDLRRHHHGHERHEDLAGHREVIADSIELVARGHLFDARGRPQRLRQDDSRHGHGAVPARRAQRDALRRLDPARPLPGPRRDDHRRLRGRSARTRSADDRRGAAPSSRRVASPGAGACGGQFTANTMAMAFEVLGISPMAPEPRPGPGRHQGAGGVRGRQAGRWRCCGAACAQRDHHQGVARERDRRRRQLGRLDQRRAAPARGRQGGRRRRSTSTTSTASRAHAAAVRPQARAGGTTPTDMLQAGGCRVRRPAPEGGRACSTRTR